MVRISDYEVIEFLTKNARMPYVSIARALGVSEAAVRKRIRALEAEGKIKGYTAVVDAKALGFIDTLIGLDTTPEGLFKVIEHLKRKKEVKRVWLSSGDHMVMFRAWFKDNNHLRNFVRALERKKEVVKVCPAILVEEM